MLLPLRCSTHRSTTTIKKLTRKLTGARLYLTPTYLSNGHWLLPRTLLDTKLDSPEALKAVSDLHEESDAFVVRIIPEISGHAWTMTPWFYQLPAGRPLVRVAVDAEGSRMYFDAGYCAMLGLIAGCVLDAKSAAHAARWGDIVLMGMRVSDNDLVDLPAKPTKTKKGGR